MHFLRHWQSPGPDFPMPVVAHRVRPLPSYPSITRSILDAQVSLGEFGKVWQGLDEYLPGSIQKGACDTKPKT